MTVKDRVNWGLSPPTWRVRRSFLKFVLCCPREDVEGDDPFIDTERGPPATKTTWLE